MKEGIFFNSIEEFLYEYEDKETTLLLFVAEETKFDVNKFKDVKAHINGAILPEIIFNCKHYKSGLIACELDHKNDLFLVDLNNFQPYKQPFKDVNSLIVLVDGLSTNISLFLDNLKNSIEDDTKVIGAGAGKSNFKQEPVIFTNNRIYEDVALIITTKMKDSITLDNSLRYMDGPFLSTSSVKNILKTLNFKNAIEVYRNTIEADCGIKITKDNFAEFSKYYPLGIEKTNEQTVIRNAIELNPDNNLILVGEILQNSTINILKYNYEPFQESSLDYIKKSSKHTKDKLLIFNCFSRMNLLKEKFDDELVNIQNKLSKTKNLFGAMSLGEIQNTSKKLIFNNNSCVLGLLD